MSMRIVILGGGTGGTLTANRLHRHYHRDVEITVVDQDDHHVYQPGLLFVPFGLAHHQEIVRPRHAQLHRDIRFVQQAIDRVELERDTGGDRGRSPPVRPQDQRCATSDGSH